MMEVSGVSHGTFLIKALVPEDMVSVPTDGDWAAWLGLAAIPVGRRRAVVLVSIAVTTFSPPSAAPGEALAARLRARHLEPAARVEQFTTPAGHPAVSVRRQVTKRANRREVTTGQAQVLVAYAKPRALGVVSGVCPHPDDLDLAAALVAEIAGRLTVTAAAAAA